MCRNIRPLFNFEPPAYPDEVHAASLQYVRKVSGMNRPSKANEQYFDEAVHDIAHITQHLLDHLRVFLGQGQPAGRQRQCGGFDQWSGCAADWQS